ncbi:MAG: hypothetical protein GY941_22575 [Planctomycetes bacterium]|nr:hypothetical protein [Planctomycetota bacterium]
MEEKDETNAATSTMESSMEKAFNYLREGNREAAEKLFDQIDEEVTPKVALAAYMSGQLAKGDFDFGEAMSKYRKAVVLEGDNPDYLLAAGKMALTLGEYDESKKFLEDLADLCKDDPTKEDYLTQANDELSKLNKAMESSTDNTNDYKHSLEPSVVP